MNKISRTELKCATVTVEKERQAYGMHKKSRRARMPNNSKKKKDCEMHKNSAKELKCATVTVKKYSQVYGMLKKRRIELGCPIITVEKESQVCAMHKRIEWSLDEHQ